MKIINSLFAKRYKEKDQLSGLSAGNLTVMGMLLASSTFFNDDWKNFRNRKDKTFELMILSVIFILKKVKQFRPLYYHEFTDDLFHQFYLFARQEQIIQMLPVDYTTFLESRLIQYNNEFSLDDEGMIKLPGHFAYNLLVHPLSEESGICENLFELMSVQEKILPFYEQLMWNIDAMISLKFPQR